MAKIVFLTLYDYPAYGIRTMSAFLEAHGHETGAIYFKRQTSKPVRNPSMNRTCYEVITPKEIVGHHSDVNFWTETELALLLGKLEELEPDIIGISTRSNFDFFALSLSRQIRKRIPRVFLVAGGFGPTFRPDIYLDLVDAVVFGDGEFPLLRLADYVDGKLPSLDRVPSLRYRDRGQTRNTAIHPQSIDLDALPVPRPFFPNTFIIDNDTLTDERDLVPTFSGYSILTSRGCPYTCSYCTTAHLQKVHQDQGCRYKAYRIRSVDSIVKELTLAKEAMQLKRIFFLNPVIMGPCDYLRSLLSEIRDNFDVKFFAYFDTRQMLKHPDLLDLAVSAGLEKTGIGIQSGCERFSHRIYKRRVTNEEIVRISGMYKEKGVIVDYQMIGGNPLETEEDLRESFDLVKRIAKDSTRALYVFRLTNLNGTELTKRLQDENCYLPPAHKFLYDGWRLQLRYQTDDDAYFDRVSGMPIFKDFPNFLPSLFPKTLKHLYESTKTAQLKLLEKKCGRSSREDRNLLFELTLLKRKPRQVVVWGTRQTLESIRRLFTHVEQLIWVDPDAAATGGDPAAPTGLRPDVLSELSPVPLFICSEDPEGTAARILERHPQWESHLAEERNLSPRDRSLYLEERIIRSTDDPDARNFYDAVRSGGSVVLWGTPDNGSPIQSEGWEGDVALWVDHRSDRIGRRVGAHRIEPPEALRNAPEGLPILLLADDRQGALDHLFVHFPELWDRVSFYSLTPLEELHLIGDWKAYQETVRTLRRSSWFRAPAILESHFPLVARLGNVEREAFEQHEHTDSIRASFQNSLYFLPEKEIIVWGAGELYQEIQDVFSGNEVIKLIDESPQRQGTQVNGIEVAAPHELRNLPDRPIFVCSREKVRVVNYLRKAHQRFSLVF